MREIIEQVDDYLRQAGNLLVPDEPGEPSREHLRLSFALLIEELGEGVVNCVSSGWKKSFTHLFEQVRAKTSLALSSPDSLYEHLDALGDLLFVAVAAVRNCGVCPELLLAEICRSNLTRFREGHSWREDGKHLKSPLCEKPDIAGVIEQSRRQATDRLITRLRDDNLRLAAENARLTASLERHRGERIQDMRTATVADMVQQVEAQLEEPHDPYQTAWQPVENCHCGRYTGGHNPCCKCRQEAAT